MRVRRERGRRLTRVCGTLSIEQVIKKRIEDLIAREFLERDKDNPNTCARPGTRAHVFSFPPEAPLFPVRALDACPLRRLLRRPLPRVRLGRGRGHLRADRGARARPEPPAASEHTGSRQLSSPAAAMILL